MIKARKIVKHTGARAYIQNCVMLYIRNCYANKRVTNLSEIEKEEESWFQEKQ